MKKILSIPLSGYFDAFDTIFITGISLITLLITVQLLAGIVVEKPSP